MNPDSELPERCLVAGVGNPLRGDDGFGPAVIRALENEARLPQEVTAVDVGIGGVGLVPELMSGYTMLVLVDALDLGDEPGTVWVLESGPPPPPGSRDRAGRSVTTRLRGRVPERVFIAADALGVLPTRIRIVGCQPACTQEPTLDLSPPVRAAIGEATTLIRRLVAAGHPHRPRTRLDEPRAERPSNRRSPRREEGHGPPPR